MKARSRINITFPVFNAERQLAASIWKVSNFLRAHSKLDCEMIIADNGSTDSTLKIALSLKRELGQIEILHRDDKGRGGALRDAWLLSKADVLSYMDIDLSTDLRHFPELIGAVVSGDADLAVGSRLHPDSATTRGWKREWISRCYNWLVRRTLGIGFSDAQCGFKAINQKAARRLLPAVKDDGWFFDTELLVLAEKSQYKVHEVPVRWVEDTGSCVRILSTAWGDLKGLARLRKGFRDGAHKYLERANTYQVQESANTF